MPNWKKLITSGSHASLSSVTGSILLSGDLQANSNNILGVAKVGAASNDEYFDFGTDAMINKFKNFKQALVDGDIAKAQAEMKDSLWYRQTTNRAERLIEKMGKSL